MMAAFLFDRPGSPATLPAKVFSTLLLLLGYSVLCWLAFSNSIQNWDKVWAYRVTFLEGWAGTIGISAVALILSTMIGVLAALARRSRFLPLRYSAIAYVETIRGLPLVVLVLFGFMGDLSHELKGL